MTRWLWCCLRIIINGVILIGRERHASVANRVAPLRSVNACDLRPIKIILYHVLSYRVVYWTAYKLSTLTVNSLASTLSVAAPGIVLIFHIVTFPRSLGLLYFTYLQTCVYYI